MEDKKNYGEMTQLCYVGAPELTCTRQRRKYEAVAAELPPMRSFFPPCFPLTESETASG